MKIGVNSLCPYGSAKKYKNCCAKFHKGAIAKDALTLMKSRYSAYAIADTNYIIKTTHPNNCDYREEKTQWKREIEHFCKSTNLSSTEYPVHNFMRFFIGNGTFLQN